MQLPPEDCQGFRRMMTELVQLKVAASPRGEAAAAAGRPLPTLPEVALEAWPSSAPRSEHALRVGLWQRRAPLPDFQRWLYFRCPLCPVSEEPRSLRPSSAASVSASTRSIGCKDVATARWQCDVEDQSTRRIICTLSLIRHFCRPALAGRLQARLHRCRMHGIQ